MDITVAHSLESVFEIESGTTVLPEQNESCVDCVVLDNGLQLESVDYDCRDTSIDQQLEHVRQQAIMISTVMQQGIEFAEPRNIPRMGEVAIQALGTALDAIKQKSEIKKHKDKLRTNGGINSVTQTTNNMLVVSRNDLIKQIASGEL